MKKIILIWDFDGPIGQINSSYPYNFNYDNLEIEIENVKWLLSILKTYNIQCCFAITGFSAENGKYPYVFPELIKEISNQGHEVASHSWRHEWTPIFKEDQIDKSLRRSKEVLEKQLVKGQKVCGFVPPHNRPMTWVRKFAFSLGDRGLFPFFKMGNVDSLITLLNNNDYKWVRLSHQNIFTKLGFKKHNPTGRIYNYKKLLILENHYTGFDDKVVNHILTTNYDTYTISAHPLMLLFENKAENKENFLNFIDSLANSNQKIEYILPSEIEVNSQ